MKGKLLKVFNKIVVILVLKCDNFIFVKYFRLIVCCIVFYKVIFKVILNRF